jgi:hypothetical protein
MMGNYRERREIEEMKEGVNSTKPRDEEQDKGIKRRVCKVAHQIHSSLQGLRLTGQAAGPTGQDVQTLPKGGIKPFDESGVTPTVALTELDQLRKLEKAALDHPAGDTPLTGSPALNYLRPGSPLGATDLPMPGQLAATADIASLELSSCWTFNIRAKYLWEVHWALLLVVVTLKFARDPLFFQIYPFITLCCGPTIMRI